jgi:hypothetical protein
MDVDAAVAAAQRALTEEFGGELSITEKVGVCAAELIVISATLKLILSALQAANVAAGG